MIQFFRKLLSSINRSNKGICAICDKTFSEKTIKNAGSLSFCSEHYQYFKNNTWIKVDSCTSNPENPNDALIIQNKHIELLIKNILSYIECKYEVKDDQIYTVFNLYITESDIDLYKLL